MSFCKTTSDVLGGGGGGGGGAPLRPSCLSYRVLAACCMFVQHEVRIQIKSSEKNSSHSDSIQRFLRSIASTD